MLKANSDLNQHKDFVSKSIHLKELVAAQNKILVLININNTIVVRLNSKREGDISAAHDFKIGSEKYYIRPGSLDLL